MSKDILAFTVITMRPPELNVKLRKKEMKTIDVKQNPVTDWLCWLWASVCLYRGVSRPAASVKGKCQWRRHEPPVYSVQSVMDWLDPLGSFAVSFWWQLTLAWSEARYTDFTQHTLFLHWFVNFLVTKVRSLQENLHIEKSLGCVRETPRIKQLEACKRNSSHKRAEGV